MCASAGRKIADPTSAATSSTRASALAATFSNIVRVDESWTTSPATSNVYSNAYPSR